MKHILHPHRRPKTGFIETTVYREIEEGTWQQGNEKPFAEWWPAPMFRPEAMQGFFCADLPDMTPQDAAAELRRLKEEQGK